MSLQLDSAANAEGERWRDICEDDLLEKHAQASKMNDPYRKKKLTPLSASSQWTIGRIAPDVQYWACVGPWDQISDKASLSVQWELVTGEKQQRSWRLHQLGSKTAKEESRWSIEPVGGPKTIT